MAIQGTVPVTTLERVVSQDFNRAQDIINRTVVEAFRVWAREIRSGLTPIQADVTNVASGLTVVQSAGTNVVVNPGLLAQDVAASPPAVPTPGALDSDYRIGLQLSTHDPGDPWDATAAWWLLEARVVRTTTLSEARDIFNPATETFAPSGAPLDKQYESQIEFAWKKGTASQIPTPTAGFARIGALYRPALGGAITDADIVQLVAQVDDLSSHVGINGTAKRDNFRFRVDPTTLDATFSLAGQSDGVRVWAHGHTAQTLRSVVFIDPGDVGDIATADLWWYVYLAAGNGCLPSNLYGANIDHRGLIIVSRTPPNESGTNSGAIQSPDPFPATIGTGKAVHLGCFAGSGAGANMAPIDVADNGEGVIPDDYAVIGLTAANSYLNGTPTDFGILGPGATEAVPYGVDLELEIRTNFLDPTSVALGMFWVQTAVGEMTPFVASCRDLGLWKSWWHKGASLIITPTATGLSVAMATIAVANVANNVYELRVCGIRF